MEVVSIRVDPETREKMRQLSHINWSGFIRRAIADRIREEERENRRISSRSLSHASKLTDDLRRPSPGWSSEEEIRRWRDLRR